MANFHQKMPLTGSIKSSILQNDRKMLRFETDGESGGFGCSLSCAEKERTARAGRGILRLKELIVMEWIDRLNASIQYLEENLAGEIDYQRAAQIACCSVYHYQRMFAYLAGVPLAEYLRRRRMSLAAAELMGGNAKVVDVALKYGYSSPTAFNRTFQRVHGATPSAVQRGAAAVKAYPPISFQITVQGVTEMEYRIEKRDAFRVVGVTAPMSKEIEQNFEIVPRLWEQAAADGTLPRLAALMDGEPKGVLGICTCYGEEDWYYGIASASSQEPPEGMKAWIVPAFTWAVFAGEGPCPQSIQELEQRIVREWLPTSGYQYDDGPDVEVYLSPNPADARFEVWIPVVKI